MAREFGYRPTEARLVPTPDELVVHLREAGASGVYLSRNDAFRDGVIPITATFAATPGESAYGCESGAVREMLRSVFESIGDQLRFHGHEWFLEWTVEPAFAEPNTDLFPLYDRRIEQTYGDGFNLWNLVFVYEESDK
ncbi:hypothetical protein [Natrinema halophilum]|uniref:hypothetical protein n=1 Tax=Natrinema halophilum TaxID=1699371 RepID=UPI001F202637|nr:hypothetical protein [Natrinema halophilum]UHQ96094.1 hypothetical protein HYG82_22455 [Natrinema halophilum]